MAEKKRRIFFLDNLKAFTVCLMIVFHVALCYMAYAPEWWYTVDKADPQFSFTVFVMWADIFIMPVMFFVSGYFGLMSLSKQTAMQFWKNKLVRIIVPWIAGVVLFAPPITFIMFASRGIPMDYVNDYLFKLFLFGPCFSHVQYWFLGMLTYLYAALFIFCRLRPGFRERQPISLPGAKLFVGFAALCYVCTAGAYFYTGGNNDLWTFIWPVLVYQPTRIAFYPLYFFLGAYAWRHQWFVEGGYRADSAKWLPAFIVTGIAYVFYTMFGAQTAGSSETYMLVRSAIHVLFLLSAVFGLLAIFQSKLDYTNGFLGELAANSYNMYYTHMGLVMLIAWGFLGIELPAYAKYAAVSILSLLASYLTGKMLMVLPCFASGKKAKEQTKA
ncbi:MAG: acyltransferase family protein [Anaerovibrio sp.]|nr:acyltransferase family protein [Anaerovibrio sp.]